MDGTLLNKHKVLPEKTIDTTNALTNIVEVELTGKGTIQDLL